MFSDLIVAFFIIFIYNTATELPVVCRVTLRMSFCTPCIYSLLFLRLFMLNFAYFSLMQFQSSALCSKALLK